MKILKFGGTSVGKPENLKIIYAILEREIVKGTEPAAVFSAFSGVTNQLIDISRLAAKKDLAYRNLLVKLRLRHIQFVETLFPPSEQKNIATEIDTLINELQEIVHGIYLLKELSDRSKDLIM
ncbi:MAG TPA: bifunctional aspartate kinase/homoserine dehydrogenase I, partial [Candidatus Marinimicrobia bacterium]|nr:bifunctional aspartate kinase/homoserine dehydrogenase I [Candidatus Neomarinimicrobiota bacterium]